MPQARIGDNFIKGKPLRLTADDAHKLFILPGQQLGTIMPKKCQRLTISKRLRLCFVISSYINFDDW